MTALAQADKRGKKERFVVLNKTAPIKMLPELYINCLKSQLSASQLLTLEMVVWLLQFHKQIRIERLAACLPLPILYESRRRHVQRFLSLPQLSSPLLWFPLIKSILLTQIQPGVQVIVPLDRTQWKQNNLFVVSVITVPKIERTRFSSRYEAVFYWGQVHEKKGIWSVLSGSLLEAQVSR